MASFAPAGAARGAGLRAGAAALAVALSLAGGWRALGLGPYAARHGGLCRDLPDAGALVAHLDPRATLRMAGDPATPGIAERFVCAQLAVAPRALLAPPEHERRRAAAEWTLQFDGERLRLERGDLAEATRR
jgi:hypothetical protein